MMIPFYMEINLILSIFYILTIRKFMYVYFDYRHSFYNKDIFWIFYYIVQIFIGAENISPPIVLVINIVFILFLSIVSCYGSLKKYCIFTFALCTVWMLVEIIVVLALNMMSLNDMALQIAGAAISKMIMLVFSFISEHYVNQKNNWEIPFHLFLIMLIIPIGSIYIIHNVFLIASQYFSYSFFSVITGILLLIVNYIIFEIPNWIRQNVEMKEKNFLYEQQLELCSKQADEREANNLKIRQLRHDINNHMVCLLGMIRENLKEKTIIYIEEMLKNNVNCSSEDISRSGNIVVDSLVNYKYAVACRMGITFQSNIFIPQNLPFQSSHLTIIIGNLLENALDACCTLKDKKRFIEIKIVYEKDILTIIVRNPYEGLRHINSDGIFLTTKSNTYNHGLGLSLIKQAAESYNGEMLINYENGYFQNTVLIYGNTSIN